MDGPGNRRLKCPSASSLLVGFLCCISLSCTLTFAFGLNVLFNDWMTSFNASRGAMGAVQAFSLGICDLGGLLAALLERRLGRRMCFILGSVLATVGLFGGAFSNSVPVLILTVGIVAGSGFSLNHLCTLSTAMARFASHSGIIASAMSSFNGLIHLGTPVLYRYLSDQYTWRGCLMITAGILFQTVIIGVLLTSPIFPVPKRSKDQQHSSQSHEISSPQTGVHTIRADDDGSESVKQYPPEDGISKSDCSVVTDTNGLKAARNIQNELSPLAQFGDIEDGSNDTRNCAVNDGSSEAERPVVPDKNIDTAVETTDIKAGERSSQRDFYHTGDGFIDALNCVMNESSETASSFVQDEYVAITAGNTNAEATEHLLIAESNSNSNPESKAALTSVVRNSITKRSKGCHISSSANGDPSTDTPKDNLSTEESLCTETRRSEWTFLKNPVYVFAVIVVSFTVGLHVGIHIFILDLALNKGWTVNDGLVLNFAFMLGSLIGRPMVGLASLIKRVNSVHLLAICAIAGAVGMGLMGFVTDFYLMASLFFLTGFSFGSVNAIYASAVLYIAGSQSYSLAQGLLNTVEGLMEMSSGPLTGVLVDGLGSYMVPCFTYGMICLIASIVFITLECCRNPCRGNRPQNGT